jgi:hypothetical protein
LRLIFFSLLLLFLSYRDSGAGDIGFPMLTISQILSKYGPALSSNIAGRLRRAGLSPEAARQRLSRLPDGVMALRGISFPKRVRFIYLESQWGTEAFWSALIEAIRVTNPPYAAAIAAMQARGGIVPTRHFAIVSGSPVRQARQVASDVALERPSSIQLLRRADVAGEGECILLNEYAETAHVNQHSLRAPADRESLARCHAAMGGPNEHGKSHRNADQG